jgi:predicted SnoaL-like aldol condensation-catalyzing enzyme
MNIRKASLTTFAAAFVAAALASAQQAPPPAQQANPTPGCTATPAQLEANKKVAMEFFRTTGEARVALADPSYKQHNPAFKKRAEDNKVSDFEEFRNTFVAQAGRGQGAGGPGGPGGPGGRGAAAGPTPPQGNPFEVVTAECDIVTVVHKVFRQDPTAEAGKFYEAFTFDTFRVRNGKLVEHWDGAVINPPAAPASGGRGQ